MPSSTFQVLHSRCAAVPITAYVINHHKTYFKQKKVHRKLLQYHRRKKSRMLWFIQSKYYFCSFSRSAGKAQLEKTWILWAFTHFCHLVPWVFITFGYLTWQKLRLCHVQENFTSSYPDGWSAVRRLFLTKGQKRINIGRYQKTDLLRN